MLLLIRQGKPTHPPHRVYYKAHYRPSCMTPTIMMELLTMHYSLYFKERSFFSLFNKNKARNQTEITFVFTKPSIPFHDIDHGSIELFQIIPISHAIRPLSFCSENISFDEIKEFSHGRNTFGRQQQQPKKESKKSISKIFLYYLERKETERL